MSTRGRRWCPPLYKSWIGHPRQGCREFLQACSYLPPKQGDHCSPDFEASSWMSNILLLHHLTRRWDGCFAGLRWSTTWVRRWQETEQTQCQPCQPLSMLPSLLSISPHPSPLPSTFLNTHPSHPFWHRNQPGRWRRRVQRRRTTARQDFRSKQVICALSKKNNLVLYCNTHFTPGPGGGWLTWVWISNNIWRLVTTWGQIFEFDRVATTNTVNEWMARRELEPVCILLCYWFDSCKQCYIKILIAAIIISKSEFCQFITSKSLTQAWLHRSCCLVIVSFWKRGFSNGDRLFDWLP